MPSIKPHILAPSLGLPWPPRWQLSVMETLLFVPTFLMALAFELFSDNFGKAGIPIGLPSFLGTIPHFQPKLFPMEIYLLWVGAITLTQIRKWPWKGLVNPVTLLAFSLFAFGMMRALPDLGANPLLVTRNSAFVWYLALPFMIALFPLASLKWESFFRFLYFVSFVYFTMNLVYPLYSGDPRKVFWIVDLGLMLGLAYGFSTPTSAFPRIALAAIGFVLGLSFYGSVQRTTMVGLCLTVLLLFVSPMFFSGTLPRPRWRRVIWLVVGASISVAGIGMVRAYEKGTFNFLYEGQQAYKTAPPARPVDTTGGGLEKFRFYMWQDAWNLFLEAPLLGIGFKQPVVYRVYAWKGEFWENSGSFEQRTRFDNQRTSPPIAGPHNSYLNALSRMGIAGIGFLLLHLACGWLFLTRCYFACFFVLIWQMLYAFFNVSLEGPIRSFPILILVGVGLKLAIEKSTFMDRADSTAGNAIKKFPRPSLNSGELRRAGIVHVPYRFIGGEDRYVSMLRDAYRSIEFSPVNIPSESSSSDLLISAARSLSFGSPAEWDKLVKEQKIELLHLNNIHAALGPAFLRWIISRGIPTVMTVHNHRFYCTNGLALYSGEVCKACRPKPSLIRPILRNCNGSLPKSIYHAAAMKEIRSTDLLMRAVNLFLAPSPYVARELQIAGYSPSKIRIFPHAVDISKASNQQNHPASDVVFVGRLSQEKGILHLLEAARRLPNHSFAIVGEGPLEGQVRAAAKAAGNLRYFGKMKQPDALAIMRAARVACVPSLCHESFSLVAAEALSFGLRLVVPDTQSFLHYGEEPIGAITAIVTNPESLAYSLATALDQGPRSPQEVAVIKERFSPHGFQERLRQVVAEIIPV
jgi:glycosyltransferase involved in cell wall biosynthesis/O-antigen ligase